MATTIVRSESDLIAISQRTSSDALIVNFAVNQVKLTAPLIMENARNITFVGATAPGRSVTLTGDCVTLAGVENIEFSNTSFYSVRPDKDPGKYEKWWKPLRIYGYTPEAPSKNVRLIRCSLIGMTDEIEIGPCAGLPVDKGVSREAWYANHPEKPAVLGLLVEDTLWGPPSYNYMTERAAHNHNGALNCVRDVVIRRVVLCGANKRSLQFNGKNILMEDCAVTDYRSMAVGLHAGAAVTLRRCQFWRGLRNLMPNGAVIIPMCHPVEVVNGTYTTDLAQLGGCTLGIDATTFEASASGAVYKSGWTCYGSRFTPEGKLTRVGVAGPRIAPTAFATLVGQVGSGAPQERAIKTKLVANKGTGWAYSW